MFSERPAHDWTSHAADAFRYLAVGLREPRNDWAAPQQPLVITEDDSPGVDAMRLMIQQERGGPPVYRDRNGNWRVMEVITEEE